MPARAATSAGAAYLSSVSGDKLSSNPSTQDATARRGGSLLPHLKHRESPKRRARRQCYTKTRNVRVESSKRQLIILKPRSERIETRPSFPGTQLSGDCRRDAAIRVDPVLRVVNALLEVFGFTIASEAGGKVTRRRENYKVPSTGCVYSSDGTKK